MTTPATLPPAANLTPRDRALLRTLAPLVPAEARPDWLRTWHAELWHARFGHHRPLRPTFFLDLSLGLALDAFWLRRESWRAAYSGTAGLCLASLAALCAVAAFLATRLTASEPAAGWHTLSTLLTHSVFATPLVLFVGSATGWRYTQPALGAPATRHRTLARIRRTGFLAGKTTLSLTLAALTSSDLFLPFYRTHRGMSDVLQQLFFVLLALLALRWSFADQAARCTDCLRALTSPRQVGRPSHNLLEWAGTEQLCPHGHGSLSSPEMISSWCEHPRWIEPLPATS